MYHVLRRKWIWPRYTAMNNQSVELWNPHLSAMRAFFTAEYMKQKKCSQSAASAAQPPNVRRSLLVRQPSATQTRGQSAAIFTLAIEKGLFDASCRNIRNKVGQLRYRSLGLVSLVC